MGLKSAASFAVNPGRLGDDDLEELKKGKKVDDLVGECDGLVLLEYRGGMSIVVRDLECPREDAGGGKRGMLLSSRLSLGREHVD